MTVTNTNTNTIGLCISPITKPTWSVLAVPFGRFCYSLVFILSGFGHFSAATIGYAASMGVPFPILFVPVSGLMIIIGGFSILLGYKARFGAGLIILFLIPVTLVMHKFWAAADTNQALIQQSMFLKNLSLMGAAMLIFLFGSGPMSLDTKRDS